MTATRWPVHPAPIPGEAASSWLTRLAAALHIDAGILLDDLGYHLNTMVELDDLTIAMPARLARRLVLTGALLGDDGVVVVDDGLGVERPRPVVLGGAVVVVVTWSSSE